MQTDPLTPRASIPPPPARRPAIGADPPPTGDKAEPQHVTRAAVVWAATVAGLAILALLIVFILQNQDQVHVQYFGLIGAVPLGMALFIAAVTGGFLVAIAGAIRITQLRIMATRVRRRSPARPPVRARHQLF